MTKYFVHYLKLFGGSFLLQEIFYKNDESILFEFLSLSLFSFLFLFHSLYRNRRLDSLSAWMKV